MMNYRGKIYRILSSANRFRTTLCIYRDQAYFIFHVDNTFRLVEMLTNYSRANYFERVAPLPRSSLYIYYQASHSPFPFLLPSLKISFTFLLHLFPPTSNFSSSRGSRIDKRMWKIRYECLSCFARNIIPKSKLLFFFAISEKFWIIRFFLHLLIYRIFQEVSRIFPFSFSFRAYHENFNGSTNYERFVEHIKIFEQFNSRFLENTISLKWFISKMGDFDQSYSLLLHLKRANWVERASITFSLFLIRKS